MNNPLNDIYTNAGCLLRFAEGCRAQERSDALDSLLYTQLCADKRFNRFTATAEWSVIQSEALHTFGWKMGGREAFSLPASDLPKGGVCDWLRSKLPSFVSVAEFDRLWSSASTCHRHDPAQPGWQAYAKAAMGPEQGGANKAVLQFAFAQAGAVLTLMSIIFTRRKPFRPDALFETLSASDIAGNVEIAFQVRQQIEAVYGYLREGIGNGLEDRRAALTFQLQGGAL
ncbi:hypothetical protein ACIPL1_06135 [Pseudomonas sp. NPDC090202]|uniref:hypothetical protein n=1 Tax=unclassified Pseudomonas TaxID=196821 RepID=UPI003815F4C0